MAKVKKYPIGIQTFSELVTEGYYYVDKTPCVHKMATEGKFYFLSRPRRFGKICSWILCAKPTWVKRNTLPGCF